MWLGRQEFQVALMDLGSCWLNMKSNVSANDWKRVQMKCQELMSGIKIWKLINDSDFNEAKHVLKQWPSKTTDWLWYDEMAKWQEISPGTERVNHVSFCYTHRPDIFVTMVTSHLHHTLGQMRQEVTKVPDDLDGICLGTVSKCEKQSLWQHNLKQSKRI